MSTERNTSDAISLLLSLDFKLVNTLSKKKQSKFGYRKYAFARFTQHTIRQACTNAWRQIAVAAKLFTVATNVLGPRHGSSLLILPFWHLEFFNFLLDF
jgi:hypothetical protein